MTIDEQWVGDVLVIAVRGEGTVLDPAEVVDGVTFTPAKRTDLEDLVRQRIELGARKILLNLENVTWKERQGFAAILRIGETA